MLTRCGPNSLGRGCQQGSGRACTLQAIDFGGNLLGSLINLGRALCKLLSSAHFALTKQVSLYSYLFLFQAMFLDYLPAAT